MFGGLAYYSASKYFPDSWKSAIPVFPRWVGMVLLSVTAGIYFFQWGWAVGVPVWLVSVPLACSGVVFLLNIRKAYAAFWMVILVVFLAIDLIN